MSEDDSIGVKTDGVYIPSAFPIKRAEPDVSLVSADF
jgi:hypothetical protein